MLDVMCQPLSMRLLASLSGALCAAGTRGGAQRTQDDRVAMFRKRLAWGRLQGQDDAARGASSTGLPVVGQS